MLAEHAVDGGPGGAIVFRQLSQAETTLTITVDRIAIKIERLASDAPAFEPRTAHAGLDSLDDQVAFELRDGADDDDDRPA